LRLCAFAGTVILPQRRKEKKELSCFN
jgi:hypothetical protein